MQLLKVEGCLQDGGQHESDYDSQGSDSERSDQDPENKVNSLTTCIIIIITTFDSVLLEYPLHSKIFFLLDFQLE